jgi:hypothetical protein
MFDYLTNPQKYIIQIKDPWTRLVSELPQKVGSGRVVNPQMLKMPPFCVDDAEG